MIYGTLNIGAAAVFGDFYPITCCDTRLGAEVDRTSDRISPKTKAIVVVDTHGGGPKLHELEQRGCDHGISPIEDAVGANGISGRAEGPAGNVGLACTFSCDRSAPPVAGGSAHRHSRSDHEHRATWHWQHIVDSCSLAGQFAGNLMPPSTLVHEVSVVPLVAEAARAAAVTHRRRAGRS